MLINETRVSRLFEKVQVGNDQEKAQSERKFPLQKPRWETTKLTIMKIHRKPNEQLFSQKVATQLPKLNQKCDNIHKAPTAQTFFKHQDIKQ